MQTDNLLFSPVLLYRHLERLRMLHTLVLVSELERFHLATLLFFVVPVASVKDLLTWRSMTNYIHDDQTLVFLTNIVAYGIALAWSARKEHSLTILQVLFHLLVDARAVALQIL